MPFFLESPLNEVRRAGLVEFFLDRLSFGQLCFVGVPLGGHVFRLLFQLGELFAEEFQPLL